MGKIKKICVVFLFALLGGCGGDILDRGCSLEGSGFASDTTAILLKHCWEEEEIFSNASYGSKTNYLYLKLSLIDVRFHNVYWESTEKSHNYDILKSVQWDDSTMLIEDWDKEHIYSLWKVGNNKLQKISFNWKIDKTEYDGELTSKFRLHPWKNDSILVFSNFPEFRGHAVIDTKTLNVTAWLPEGENAWVTACDDIWYGDNGGLCLVNNKDTRGFSLLSEKGDTLDKFIYNYKTEGNIRRIGGNAFNYNFISVSLGECYDTQCNTYPLPKKMNELSAVMVRYDESGNVAQEPLFWIYSYEKFVDSLGNITEY